MLKLMRVYVLRSLFTQKSVRRLLRMTTVSVLAFFDYSMGGLGRAGVAEGMLPG